MNNLSGEKLSASLTPPANRGLVLQTEKALKPSTVHIDWIQGVVKGNAEEITKFVRGSTREEFVLIENVNRRLGKVYQNYYYGTHGTLILFNPDKEFDDCLVSIPGTPCSRMGTVNCWRIINGLCSAYNAKFTRIDLKVRVDARLINYDKLVREAVGGNITGVRSLPSNTTSRMKTKKGIEELHTVYLGSRESGQYMRIYNPLKCHKVEGYADIELVMKDKKAQLVAAALCAIERTLENLDTFPTDLAQAIGAVALGQIKFIDRSADRNISRCPLLDFWQRLVDFVGYTVKLVAGLTPTTLRKNQEWLERQVLKSLAMQKKAKGGEWFWNWLRSGLTNAHESFTREQEALIKEFQNVCQF